MMDIQKVKWLQWLFLGLYFIVSVYVMLNYMHSTLLRERYGPTRYERVISGKGPTPYVSRVLVPVMTRTIVALTPDSIIESVDASFLEYKESQDEGAITRAMPWLKKLIPPHQSSYSRLVTLAIIYAFLLGYVAIMFKLAGAIFPGDEAMKWCTPLFALLVIPSLTWPFQHIYDFSTLALSALCYLLIATNRFRAYLIAFAFACLNKETSIFILLFFAIWGYKALPTERYRMLLIAQVAIYAAIKLLLFVAFINNPGGMLESHTLEVLNKDFFLNAGSFRIPGILALAFLLTFRWEQKPYFAKIGLIFIPILFVAYIFYGNPGEYRICFDILPLLVLLITHTLIRTTGIADAALFDCKNDRG